jgi:membrane-associated phospholipid phosphatase
VKLLIKNNLVLFILAGIFLIGGGLAILITKKHELHLFLNSCVCKPLDTFFIYFTYIGDGLFVVAILLILLFRNFRLFIAGTTTYALSSAIAQFFKYFIFAHKPRPLIYFQTYFKDLHFKKVEGIDLLFENTFPSGHTTAAFSLFFTVALATSKNWLKVVYFFIAFTVAFSRVYLSQHFFEDVYGGALFGIVCSVIFFYIFYFSSYSGKFNKLDTSLIKLITSPNKNV